MVRIVIVILLTGIISGCSGPYAIRENGLKFVRLGDPMPPAGLLSLGGYQVRDTVYNEGGFRWRAAILRLADGQVFVEEDFVGAGRVNRIRVESESLSVKKKISVGMTFGELKGFGRNWEILYLSDYRLLDVTSPTRPSIHYLLREEKQSPDAYAKETITPEDISDEAEIVAIVIM